MVVSFGGCCWLGCCGDDVWNDVRSMFWTSPPAKICGLFCRENIWNGTELLHIYTIITYRWNWIANWCRYTNAEHLFTPMRSTSLFTLFSFFVERFYCVPYTCPICMERFYCVPYTIRITQMAILQPCFSCRSFHLISDRFDHFVQTKHIFHLSP